MSARQHLAPLVREAMFADLDAIAETLMQAHAEASYALPEPELPYALKYILDLMAQGLVWVADVEGKVSGVLMIDAVTWPWNSKIKHAENVHFWVEPAHRSGGVAQKLLARAEKKCRAANIVFMPRLTYGSSEAESIDRFMRINGFEYIGGNFRSRE